MKPAILLTAFLLSAFCPFLSAQPDPIGHIMVSNGPAQIAGGVNIRPADQAEELFPGDSLITGPNGYLQLRLSDGTLLALQDHSEIRINEYAFSPGQTDNQLRFSLVKGTLRVTAGEIGSIRLSTAFGTIDTALAVFECATDNGLYCGVYFDSISLSAPSGSLSLGAGADYDYGFLSTGGASPAGLLQTPAQLGVVMSGSTLGQNALPAASASSGPSLPIRSDQTISNPAFPSPAPISVVPTRKPADTAD